ncbi:MAG: T9SS type A sorting domain-containing protein [Bacteroidota bacterium]
MRIEKLIIPILIFALNGKSMCQEVFTNALQGNAIIPVESINEQLYVSVFDGNLTSGIYKFDFNDPDVPILVGEFPAAELGALKIEYDPSENMLYALRFSDLFRFDLSSGLPIVPQSLFLTDVSGQRGLIHHNNFLYTVSSNAFEIRKHEIIDPTTTNTEVIYTETAEDLLIISDIVGEYLYFFAQIAPDNVELKLFRININQGNPEKELVSNMDGITGFVQGTHVKNNALYATIETIGSGPNLLVKFDLNLPFPSDFQIISEGPGGIIPLEVTSFGTNIYFTDGLNQSIYYVEDPTLLLEDTEEARMAVYPNPVNTKLYVQFLSGKELEYSVFDISGKKLIQGTYSSNGIDVGLLETGVYFLQLKSTDGKTQQVEKIMKD